jgi:TDG/mug DNA glycosylase family protein
VSHLDPHARTLAVYEARAEDWTARRTAPLGRAADFTRWIDREAPSSGVVADLGCGPGWHLPALPEHAVALDGAAALLAMVPEHAGTAPRVRADLRGLPFRRGALRAAWASRSYVHVARPDMPMALWDLHRALAPGGLAELVLFPGDAEHTAFDDDDLPGRSFSLWPEQLLRDVLEGAGFEVVTWEEESPRRADHSPMIRVRLRRLRTLADTVGPGMSLLLVGLNPSLHAADAGVGFSGPGNRGWPALVASGIATVARDPRHLLRERRVGMTDLVKRATTKAAELRRGEYRHGLARLDRLCAWLRPAAVCVVGLTGWRHALGEEVGPGEQRRRLGGRPVWLMPNPSGLNAATGLEDLVEHLRSAARLATRADGGPGGSTDPTML